MYQSKISCNTFDIQIHSTYFFNQKIHAQDTVCCRAACEGPWSLLPSPLTRVSHSEAFLLFVLHRLPPRTTNNVFIEVFPLIGQLPTLPMTFPLWTMKVFLAHVQYPISPSPTPRMDLIIFIGEHMPVLKSCLQDLITRVPEPHPWLMEHRAEMERCPLPRLGVGHLRERRDKNVSA